MADLRGSERDLVPATAAEVVPSRYRHPGDVVLLVGSTVWLLVALGVALIAGAELLGHRAAVVPGSAPGSTVGRVLVGLVQVIAVLAPVVVVAALLVVRRFRFLGAGFPSSSPPVAAGAAWTALSWLAGTDRPPDLLANRTTGSSISTAAWPGVAWFAGAVAVTLVAGSSAEPLVETRGVARFVAAAAELIAGVALPMELVLACAVGSLVGAGVLVVFGAPDHRIGERGIAEALAAAGIPVLTVRPAEEAGKGSRPFVATLRDGDRRFVKILGQDERDADLLYRGYRFMRLRDVGDVRPAASLKQAVEHQALAGMMAERAGVHAPRVHRVVEAPDGSVMLIMELVDGLTLAEVAEEDVTDQLVAELWREVDRLHRAHIAHRSLRTANVMFRAGARPWIVDYSFSELSASDRAMDLDVAELLASLAVRIGPDRAVARGGDAGGRRGRPGGAAAAAAGAVGVHPPRGGRNGQGADPDGRPPHGHRAAGRRTGAAPAGARPHAADDRPRRRRVLLHPSPARPGRRQLAGVPIGGLVVAAARGGDVCLTYVAGAVGMCGTVPYRLPLGPTVTTQFASSFVNRVSPANVGGMALNARFLQKCGVDPGSAVAAIGLNALAGGIVHPSCWSSSSRGRAPR